MGRFSPHFGHVTSIGIPAAFRAQSVSVRTVIWTPQMHRQWATPIVMLHLDSYATLMVASRFIYVRMTVWRVTSVQAQLSDEFHKMNEAGCAVVYVPIFSL
jgi:hypothetical protein